MVGCGTVIGANVVVIKYVKLAIIVGGVPEYKLSSKGEINE